MLTTAYVPIMREGRNQPIRPVLATRPIARVDQIAGQKKGSRTLRGVGVLLRVRDEGGPGADLRSAVTELGDDGGAKLRHTQQSNDLGWQAGALALIVLGGPQWGNRVRPITRASRKDDAAERHVGGNNAHELRVEIARITFRVTSSWPRVRRAALPRKR